MSLILDDGASGWIGAAEPASPDSCSELSLSSEAAALSSDAELHDAGCVGLNRTAAAGSSS